MALNAKFIMRLMIFFCAFPVLLNAQINRSATELAKENIHEYLTDKIFKSDPYRPVSYGELRALDEKHSEARWSIVHKFEITEVQNEAEKKVSTQKPYEFIFYLDEKMRVLLARSYSQ
jgi:hypothetical protein